MNARLSFDHNATTPVAPEVVDAMLPYLKSHWGNPSSRHDLGAAPQKAIATARAQVAELIGAHHDEVFFTSCGTESDNWAIIGAAAAMARAGRRVVVHSAI